MDDRAIGFTRYKSKQVCEYTLMNLTQLHRWPSAVDFGPILAGKRVFVVGAGVSLEKNIHLLQQTNDMILCANSASVVLQKHGIVPDFMVFRESLNLTDIVEESDAPHIICELGANSETLLAADDKLSWFIAGYPRHFDLHFSLGVRPVFGGTSSTCSTIALALEWGASSICLVGCDLAGNHPSQGRLYHEDAPRGDLTYSYEDGLMTLYGNEANDSRCEASGQKPPPKCVGANLVQAADFSGMLPQIDALEDERNWMITQAQRHGRVEFINATEGGAGIEGWTNVALRDLIPLDERRSAQHVEATPVEKRYIPEDTVAKTVKMISRQAAVQEQVSREMLSSRGPDYRVFRSIPDIVDGSPLAESMAAHVIIDLPHSKPADRVQQVYRALRDSAVNTQHILSKLS